VTRTGTSDWRDVIAAAPAVELPELLAMLGCQADRPRLVGVPTHPDNETIGAGRLVAAWSRSLGPVTAVLATAGERCVDQVATRRLGLGVLAVGFPVWLTNWGDPNESADPLWRLAARVANDVVWWSALQRFRTQLEPLDRGLRPVVSSTMLEHHTEQLLLSTGPVRP